MYREDVRSLILFIKTDFSDTGSCLSLTSQSYLFLSLSYNQFVNYNQFVISNSITINSSSTVFDNGERTEVWTNEKEGESVEGGQR